MSDYSERRSGEVLLVLRTPDENAARIAFGAASAALSALKPRPKASLELYLGTVVLDVFEQTQAGDEFEPVKPVPGGGTREIEFWKQGRGGERSKIVSVPADWTDEEIKSKLEDWGDQYFPTSEIVRYGWNDEADCGNRD